MSFTERAPRGYTAGMLIERLVYGLDGRSCGSEQFRIHRAIGSGFAGQVYQAAPAGHVLSAQKVALKVLFPRSRWKDMFRSALFRLSYQTAFAPRLCEEAVRAGLAWQQLIRVGAGIELGSVEAVVRPLGYMWCNALCSFIEIQEWIEGRSPRPGLPARSFDEVQALHTFMANLARLCKRMGALGVARQYEWYTFVSQANVLVREVIPAGMLPFVGIDWRPGLAVPFFLPLSPTHARIIMKGLGRGRLVHYDEVDFALLDEYVQTHEEMFLAHLDLINQLKSDDALYRARLPDLWHRVPRLLNHSMQTHDLRQASVQNWLTMGYITPRTAMQWERSRAVFAAAFLLDNTPLIGKVLMRLSGRPDYRKHLRLLFVDSVYRRETCAAWQRDDVADWLASGRITASRAGRLQLRFGHYLLEKLGLSWLPAGWHRLATDSAARQDWVRRLIKNPLRLLFRPAYRSIWLQDIIRRQRAGGMINTGQARLLGEQTREPQAASFIADAAFTAGLDLFSRLVYLLLSLYGLTTRNFWPLLIALLGPVPPSGAVRFVFAMQKLARLLPSTVRRRDWAFLRAQLVGVTIAPWRWVGNLYAPVEMFLYYPLLSLLLANYFLSKMVNAIPVLGGNSKLLAFWIFYLTYSLPLSISAGLGQSFVSEKKRFNIDV